MEQLWEYIEANYNEENFNIFDAKQRSLEIEKIHIELAVQYGHDIIPNDTSYKWCFFNYYNETYKK